jgi:diadenosine tetraphosphatase ApaH/serine/threonine PP2A family protein phosphatase
MRYAILSDIHSNLEALEAVLEDIAGQGVDDLLCLGDLVGYGANPNECVHRIRGLISHVVVGNHDSAAVGQTDVSYFNPHARRAVSWTAENIAPEHARYISRLPYVKRVDGLLLVHATPSEPAEWKYLLSTQVARSEFQAFSESICFIGHSHQPVFFSTDGAPRSLKGDRLLCDPGDRYIVNVGSVGQPRDGDPRSCYAIFDGRQRTVQLRRVAYDIKSAQRKILQAGLPPVLAARLARGD